MTELAAGYFTAKFPQVEELLLAAEDAHLELGRIMLELSGF